MKVLYLISAMKKNSGKGGHYYSLRTTAEAINTKLDCCVVVIGNKESPVINQSNLKVYNLIYEKIHITKVFKDLKEIINIERPDVIHSFDHNVFFFGNLISTIYRKPYIHTKCGGPNPRIAFPKVNNLILYSQENFKYYQSSRRFKETNIKYIPNRVGEINQDFSKIHNLKSLIDTDSNSKIFLIISRINESKKNDILQAINLVNRLNSDKITAKLIIVGIVENEITGDEIKKNTNGNIYLFTGDEYTINASQLIDVADFVVGAGRSFMEAATRGKIMLCPIKNSKYPLLITEDNFDEVFKKNFSQRITLNEFNLSKNYERICQAANDKNYAAEISRYIKYVSHKYFEISSELDNYCDMYKKTQWKRCFNLLDMLFIYVVLIYFELGFEVKALGRGHIQKIRKEVQKRKLQKLS